nr:MULTISPECIES: DUF6516 family protein [unclassified Roseofilum]
MAAFAGAYRITAIELKFMLIEDYLISIKVKLLTRAVIHSFTIVKERAILDQGYFRARLTLKNGDFCETVEFFTANDPTCITESYRYQWIDLTKQKLRKRWDNVEHFPGLPNFPHHIHILEETNVYPGRSLNI